MIWPSKTAKSWELKFIAPPVLVTLTLPPPKAAMAEPGMSKSPVYRHIDGCTRCDVRRQERIIHIQQLAVAKREDSVSVAERDGAGVNIKCARAADDIGIVALIPAVAFPDFACTETLISE